TMHVSAVIEVSLIALVLAVLDQGFGDGLLAFAPSDVDYVFPSPISRRIVLLYRVPRLIFNAFFLAAIPLMLYFSFSRVLLIQSNMREFSRGPSTLAIVLCTGFYLNVALLVAVRVVDRTNWRRCLLAAAVLMGAVLGLTYLARGLDGFVGLALSAPLETAFLPVTLTMHVLRSQLTGVSSGHAGAYLAALYAVSFVLVFLTDTNFYEQSIVSSERFAALRAAAKGGVASVMAARATMRRQRSFRGYSLPPFGQGAGALLWAHLCAAWKRPFFNFGFAFLGSIVAGLIGVGAGRDQPAVGYGVLYFLAFYASIGYLTSARTAAESAIRRRDLISPLPLPAWQVVAANLSVPTITALLFGLGAGITCVLLHFSHPGYVAFALIVIFPIRVLSRMLVQYVTLLAYPDLSDRIQQVFSQFVAYLLFIPLVVVEGVLILPGILLQSPSLALGALLVTDCLFVWLLLYLAGKASAKAITTGEPVSLSVIFRGR
ncbi:MAG TPA: putative ABC exporter domain-containing protein, partial [Fimbriimonas sp.]|nr:putative ABC exporter domain-containing protein [Fimbriimonas sp.]